MGLGILLLGSALLLLLGYAQFRLLKRKARLRGVLDLSSIALGTGARCVNPPALSNPKASNEQGIPLGHEIETGAVVRWNPGNLANPHFLILGGSGAGKTQTIKRAMLELSRLEFGVVAIDFHGDLLIEGADSYPISMTSSYGVNPLVVDLDPAGGGPDPQRFLVLQSLKEAFAPMGGNQLAFLDRALSEVYRNAGILQVDYASWRREPPTFRELEQVLNRLAEAAGKDRRPEALKTKLGPAFSYGILSKPQVPIKEQGVTRIDLSKLPPGLQYLAADTLCQQLLRRVQMHGPHAKHRLFLVVDETKLMMPARLEAPHAILNRIASEGRKFGLGLIVAATSSAHLSRDILMNCFTKLILKTDKIEIPPTARRFLAEREQLSSLLEPGVGLINFGDEETYTVVRVRPYATKEGNG